MKTRLKPLHTTRNKLSNLCFRARFPHTRRSRRYVVGTVEIPSAKAMNWRILGSDINSMHDS